MPSLLPLTPASPATVLTTQLAPTGATFRTVWLPESITYTLPALSTATPRGWKNRAPLLVPSALPHTPGKPASVLTSPPG